MHGDEKKKKPIVMHLITQAEFGGAQKYVFEIATGLAHKYTFVVGAGEITKSSELLMRLVSEQIYTLKLRHVTREINPIRDFFGLVQITRCIVKLQPDIIHLHTSKMSILGSCACRLASYWLRMRHVRYSPQCVYTAHGWVFNEALSSWRKKMYIFLERYTAQFKNKIIVLSRADRNVGLFHFIGTPDTYSIIHNGVTIPESKLFSAKEARIALIRILHAQGFPEIQMHANEFWIGAVANLYENKGLDVLITAMSEVILTLNDTKLDIPVRLFIIGEGVMEQKLRTLISEKKLNNVIFLTGAIQDAWQYMAAFDLSVLPSRKEGFPYALLEAMSAGVPVIATNVGAIPECITHKKDGIIVPPDEPHILAENILELMHHGDVRTKIGMQGKKLVGTHFTRSVFLHEIDEVYKYRR